jgi:CheY-like chemotaxis protein
MPKKILLADDSLTIQKVVELTFSDSDFELVCVSNGQRALDKVREERPDLILADVVMPEKNGYEVCEAIKGNPATAKIPVVLLSGTFEPFDRERAERIGADAIVSKPFDSQQLLSQVEALLSRVPREAPAPDSGATTVVIPMRMVPPPASEDSSAEAKAAEDEWHDESEEELEDEGESASEDEPEHLRFAVASGAEPPPIPVRQATEPIAKFADEPPPFEAGFTPEDFTGTVRTPSAAEPADPFEEEYGRAGVDSAIEAFEKVHPGFGLAGEIEIDDDHLTGESLIEEGGGAPPRWLTEEPERTAPLAVTPPADTLALWDADEATVALRGPLTPPAATFSEPSSPKAPEDEWEGKREGMSEGPVSKSEETPHELEALASGTTIPELTQMLSSVVRSNGELSEADLERLAAKVVERLSDKIVREIAWEIIPDMAEIVIKKRIKELESGVE